jgi:uncharacterized protein
VTTLDNLRKHARRWLNAVRAGEPEAIARLARAYPGASNSPTLRDVQHALARERGHENWIALTRAGETPASPDLPLTQLLSAAGRGDVAGVVTILDRHPDVINQRGLLSGNSGLRTALHFGVHHEPVVRALLERGADPNIRDEGDNAFPIHFAAERGNLAVVRLLIEHGADPIGAGTTHELDALGWAVCFDITPQLDVARYLLDHGARHTIHSAVAIGDVAAIRQLVADGADINQPMDHTNRRRTPAHLAVLKRQPGSLAALIEAGADLNATDAVGLTPLDHAALLADEEMVRQLQDAGAPMTAAAAMALGRTAELDRIVAENPDVLAVTSNRECARLLTHASSRAPGQVIEALIRTITRYRSGLSVVNLEGDHDTAIDGASGYTPLHSAAYHGNDAAVDVLLRYGANPRVRDGKYCATPAGWAAYAGHPATANKILEADIDIFDAVNFDRADLVAAILDRDPGAIDRPFKAYTVMPSREDQWWPEPDCTPLQWAVARGKQNAARVLTERGAANRTRDEIDRTDRVIRFLQCACWDHHVHGKSDHRMYDRAAQRILTQDPSIARESIHTAVVCGDLEEVTRILHDRPEAAHTRGGARGWTPILYLAFARFTHEPLFANVLAIARLLLDHGADPNDFYMAGDAQYSVLTGIAGEGEQDSPRQPYASELFDLLLERGAEPFDIQVLYDTHFSGDILWWLELVYKRTIDSPRGAAWADPEWRMLDMGGYGSGARFVLETAIKKRDVRLAEWALTRGANPNAGHARDHRFPRHSPYELAVLEQQHEIAELLLRHGASRTTPSLDDRERFVDAVMRLDRDTARVSLREHPEYLQSPFALFKAAGRDRPDALALLLELGFSPDIQDQTGKRALHEAAVHDSVGAIAFLIERGAEVDPREMTYGGAPIGWASHGDHQEAMDLLSRYSRNIWTLCFRGYVERVREILADDPSLARQLDNEGCTPLWWLPDDDDQAMAIVELLLAAGADPSVRNENGRTAADWARRRGMTAVAERLEAAARP